MIPNSFMMRPMPLPALAIILGFMLLAWGADRFVAGAAATARNAGLSPLFVGLTIVALGTAAPEMLVAAVAAFDGNPGLAVGNALGSNVTNISLVLGAAALAAPLTLRRLTLRREFPMLFGIMLAAWWLLRDSSLLRPAGGLLVAGVVPLLAWMFWAGRNTDAVHDAYAATRVAETPMLSRARASLWLVLGLAALLAGSRGVVWGAVSIAGFWGVSDTVIGLSVVAVGTSLPELAASVAAARRNEHDIALGNVFGSNMFNLLVVLGLPGIIAPGPVEPAVLNRDFPVIVGLVLAVAALAFVRRGHPRLGRPAGLLLLAAFVCYQWLLYD